MPLGFVSCPATQEWLIASAIACATNPKTRVAASSPASLRERPNARTIASSPNP